MSVYVDPPIWPFGRMVMCHMVADSHEELVKMADAIGVQRRWIQHAGTWEEHFDISKSMRSKAVRAGAIELDLHEMGSYWISKRKALAVIAEEEEGVDG